MLDSLRHPLGLLPPPLPGVVRRQLSVALPNVEPDAAMVRGELVKANEGVRGIEGAVPVAELT